MADGSPRLCGATRKDGSPCRTRALPGGAFCLFHDPERGEQRKAARRAGGKNSRRPKPPGDAGGAGPATASAAPSPAAGPAPAPQAEALPLESVGQVARALALAANEVRQGTLGAKEGNCVGYLLSVLLRALE